MDPGPAPRPRFEPAARRRGMLLSIAEGMSAQAQTSFTGLGAGGPNAITIGFAFLLGADNWTLGLLAALPVLGNLAHYAAAALAPRLRERRPLVAWASTVARVSWLGIGAIPFLVGERRDLGLSVFLVLWGITNALMSLSGNLWTSWMADLVPKRIRGRYFSVRTRFTTVVAILAPLAVSLVLDHFFKGVPRRGDSASPDAELQAQGFLLVFSAAAVFGVACGLLLRAQAEPRREAPAPRSGGSLLAPFGDRRFLPLLAFLGAFGAANGLANPFWTPFQMEQLHLGYGYVNGVFVALQGLAMVATLSLWGRVVDRMGNRPVVAFALVLIVSHPLYYVVASPSRWWLMFFDATSSGIAWAGYNLAMFNLVLALAPQGRREAYVAAGAVVPGFAQALTSLLAGKLVDGLPAVLPIALGLELDPRQQIFLATSAARLGCLGLFLAAVQEPRSRPIRAVVAAAQAYAKTRFDAIKFLTQSDER